MKKKLSVAIRKGVKIAKELGFKQGTGDVIRVVRGQCEVCAIGNALLTIRTPEELLTMPEENWYKLAKETFLNANKPNECLDSNISSPIGYVWTKNDSGMKPEEIADKLAACGL